MITINILLLHCRNLALKVRLLIALLGLCALLSASRAPNLLERIQAQGLLEFLSLNGPDTVYEGAEDLSGFEYQLIKRFAEHLGVKPVITQSSDMDTLLYQVRQKPDAIGAAGIVVTTHRAGKVTFGPSYLESSSLVIGRSGAAAAVEVSDLVGHQVLVKTGSSQAELLHEQQKNYPDLQWQEADIDMQDLQERVHSGKTDFALVDRTTFEQNKAIYPDAQLQFVIAPREQIAWAFAPQPDKSLIQAATTFFEEIHNSGQLAALLDNFSNEPLEPDADLNLFSREAEEHLPRWSEHLKDAAKEYDLDWTLLAALSYQESHWDAKATSETGVRGFMMLTTATAKEMDVRNRLDAKQSIAGGAKLLRVLLDKLPMEIPPEDRLPMALAAYNLGLGHLEDVRSLAQRMGKDANRWADIKTLLPLLSQGSIYRTTRHGYARGKGAVLYVENILNFSTLLTLHEQEAERLSLANIKAASSATNDDMNPLLADALRRLTSSNSL